MDSDSSADAGDPALFAGAAWFDPIEAGLRGRIRGFIEELVEQELTDLHHVEASCLAVKPVSTNRKTHAIHDPPAGEDPTGHTGPILIPQPLDTPPTLRTSPVVELKRSLGEWTRSTMAISCVNPECPPEDFSGGKIGPLPVLLFRRGESLPFRH